MIRPRAGRILMPFSGTHLPFATARTRACSHMTESTLGSTPGAARRFSGDAMAGAPPTRAQLILRWLGRMALTAVALVFVAAVAVYGLSERRFRAGFSVPEHSIAVSEDAASV